MTKLKILVSEEKFETTATLFEDDAPKTCKGILGKLPLDGTMIHAMMSGQEVFIDFRANEVIQLDPENWEFNPNPGDIFYWYSHWGEGAHIRDNPVRSEVYFIYGRHYSPRDLTGRPTTGNLFATLDGKLDEFATICKKMRLEGTKRVRIERS